MNGQCYDLGAILPLSKSKSVNQFDLESLVGNANRILIIRGLQALHRDRVDAWNLLSGIAIDRGIEPPAIQLFAVQEVSDLLKSIGAGPMPR
jgi:hypothetical protein